MDKPTSSGSVKELIDLAKSARHRGAQAVARAHLQAARATRPGHSMMSVELVEADLLLDEDREAEAEALFKALQIAHPDSVWPIFGLARLARRCGQHDAAKEYLETALSKKAGGALPALHILRAELLFDAGRGTEAVSVLTTLTEFHPQNATLQVRLANLVKRRSDPQTYQLYVEAAIERGVAPLNLQLSHVRTLLADNKFEAAIEFLTALRDQFGSEVRIMLPLVSAYRGARQFEQEKDGLAAVIAAYPLDPALLHRLCDVYVGSTDIDLLAGVADLLRCRIAGDLVDELEGKMFLQSMQFDRALHQLRSAAKAERTPVEAHKLAWALFGTHRYRTGLRYLRFCLRLWPDNQRLLALFVINALKAGWFADAARQIDASVGLVAEHVILTHRLALYGFQGDLEATVACYEQLRKLGRDLLHHRNTITKLVFTALEPSAAEALFARIGHWCWCPAARWFRLANP